MLHYELSNFFPSRASKNYSTTMENRQFLSSMQFSSSVWRSIRKRARKAHKIDISPLSGFDLDDWKLISRMHKPEEICKFSSFGIFCVSSWGRNWKMMNWKFISMDPPTLELFPSRSVRSQKLEDFRVEMENQFQFFTSRQRHETTPARSIFCRRMSKQSSRNYFFNFIYSSCYHSLRQNVQFLNILNVFSPSSSSSLSHVLIWEKNSSSFFNCRKIRDYNTTKCLRHTDESGKSNRKFSPLHSPLTRTPSTSHAIARFQLCAGTWGEHKILWFLILI